MALKSLSPRPLKGANENATVAPGNHPSQPPRRILVVDDDSQIRQVCSSVLIQQGHQVDVAADGEAGWRALHTASLSQDRYDLLITDHQMPKLSGLELVHKLRAAHLALPVIMVSSIPPINTESLQIAAVLPKPFSPEALMKTVTEVLLFSGGTR